MGSLVQSQLRPLRKPSSDGFFIGLRWDLTSSLVDSAASRLRRHARTCPAPQPDGCSAAESSTRGQSQLRPLRQKAV